MYIFLVVQHLSFVSMTIETFSWQLEFMQFWLSKKKKNKKKKSKTLCLSLICHLSHYAQFFADN